MYAIFAAYLAELMSTYRTGEIDTLDDGLSTFALRLAFSCPVCRKPNDQRSTVKAINREAAYVVSLRLLIKCQFCPAKIGVTANMVALAQQG